MSAPPRILVTGRPGSGKTTVVARVVERLRERGVVVGGFLTEEVRGEDGRRVGFDVVTVDGQRAPLARVGLESPVRVGRYGVDVEAVRAVGIPSLDTGASVVVVDEIAPMELACPGFTGAVEALLASDRAVLAAVHRRRHLFTDRMRARDDVTAVEVTAANRDELPDALARRLAPGP